MSFVPFSKIPDFNPRTVPIKAWDAHLDAVPLHQLQQAQLLARFAQPPAWESEVRQEPPYTDRAPRDAAVLVALVMHEQPTLLLTQRTDMMTTHAGQIAFAGGKIDAGETAEQAALREAHEEIGLDPQQVSVLGFLPRYTTGTAFHITPVVACVMPAALSQLVCNPAEVADVFEVPLAFLMNPAHHARHEFEFQGLRREWFSMPWLDTQTGQERYIWGATAGMLRNLYRFLAA